MSALDHVDLDVWAGESLAVVGPSGSGKSTLLHVVGAMDTVDSGILVVDGVDLPAASRSDLVSFRRRVGFVFQRFHLLPALSALDNVLAPRIPLGVHRADVDRARALLESVGLGPRHAAMPSQLSGGEQQRVAIARALINKPVLLLADEPTGNLDSDTGRSILELLDGGRAEFGVTVMVTTHDMSVAASCDRIVRLADGGVVGEQHIEPVTDAETLERLLRYRPN